MVRARRGGYSQSLLVGSFRSVRSLKGADLLYHRYLVCTDDNAFQGRQFEIDPFDPFELHERAPTPYCWYGITPTLFDAPSRDKRADLDWVAHSFLAASPLQGNRRIVTPLLGFSWGFHISDTKNIALKPITSLTVVDWEAHLPYLRDCYTEWQFSEMPMPTARE